PTNVSMDWWLSRTRYCHCGWRGRWRCIYLNRRVYRRHCRSYHGNTAKIFSFKEAMSLYVSGFRRITIVFIILTLAWSIGTITSELGTADYLVDFAKNTTSPIIIPALLFIFGSIIAFTTGTSYGTFAIMIPIAMPLAHSLDMSMA